MNFQNESIKNLKSKSKTNQSQNFDWDIIVPDSKPDIKSIITTDGVVSITGKEIMQDRAVINGNVKLTILYHGGRKWHTTIKGIPSTNLRKRKLY